MGRVLSLSLILVCPQTEHKAVLDSSSMFVSLWSIRVIYWAGNTYQISAVGTGSVEVPPSNVIVFKGCHNVEYGTATGTGVDGA